MFSVWLTITYCLWDQVRYNIWFFWFRVCVRAKLEFETDWRRDGTRFGFIFQTTKLAKLSIRWGTRGTWVEAQARLKNPFVWCARLRFSFLPCCKISNAKCQDCSAHKSIQCFCVSAKYFCSQQEIREWDAREGQKFEKLNLLTHPHNYFRAYMNSDIVVALRCAFVICHSSCQIKSTTSLAS